MPSHRNDGQKARKEVTPFSFVPSEKGKRRATEEKGAAGSAYTHKRFGEALAELVREHQADPWRSNLKDFAREAGIPYSTLRSAAMGRTQPPREMIELVAKTLSIPPSYFREYRVLMIAEALEANPELAGTIYSFVLEKLGHDSRSDKEGK